jgi:hypothetical protein
MSGNDSIGKMFLPVLGTICLTFPTIGVIQTTESSNRFLESNALEISVVDCPGILPKQIIIEKGDVYVLRDGDVNRDRMYSVDFFNRNIG